jgi:outer membrane protein OmpA-like peptidoglycan-associated protein
MAGGNGGTDIYYCSRDDSGNWGPPVNLKEINTPGNERTPFIDQDGNLYFSSDAGLTMGGLDIFKSVRVGGKFAPGVNLGYPINSPRDDFSFTLYNHTNGYLSSNRNGGAGSDDIYSFRQVPDVTLRLEGTAYEKNTGRPLPNSRISLGQVKVTSDDSGRYYFILAKNTDYNLRGERPSYLSDNQKVTTKGLTTSQTIKKDLYLNKITLNKAIRIENIYYDFDKSDIRPDAAIELDKLIKILQDNPGIVVELGSHTDSRGNDDYNLALSQRRADAAVKYITEKGNIDAGRILARGYGETRLLNKCANGVDCTPEEHQLNRRTEFTIIKE